MSKHRTGKRKSKKSCERPCFSKDYIPLSEQERTFDHLGNAEVSSERLLERLIDVEPN